ncbi:Programmed cell death protein 2 [Linum perenne]
MEGTSAGGDGVEDLKGLRISSLDSDEDDAFEEGSRKLDVEDDDDEEDDEEVETVMLGFLEKPEHPWSLHRQSFPSKAGGAPAWLDPVNLPSGNRSLCDTCGKPLRFVLQVYAPITEKESTYHRTLFVFMCSKMSCLLRDQHEQWKRKPEQQSRSVKVFRCQLPLGNPFYSSENPRNDGNDKPSGPGAVLCDRCGTWKGDKICGRCKKAHYCSERHQRKHWESEHKYQCRQVENSLQQSSCGSSNGRTIVPKGNLILGFTTLLCPNILTPKGFDFMFHTVPTKKLWPEYEIVDEDEGEFCEKMSDDTENAMSLVSMSEKNDSMKSVIDGFKADIDKRTFANFEQRRARAPDQVLRYCRSSTAKPLWPIFSGRLPKAEIPNCKYCGGHMIFEFQILSTLLYYFKVDNEANSLDWATVVVYTCESSCDASVAYKEEFVWVQLHN